MEFWRQLIQQFRQIWSSLSRPAQVGYALVALVSFAVIAGVAVWASQPEYRVLASDLSPEAAAEMVAELRRLSVPYQFEMGGTRVMVPVAQLNEARMALAMAGMTGGSKGFELFDQTTLGTTPFVEQLTFTRAMKGELERVIEDLDSVSKARVLIARPEPTPFVREQKPVTASVVVWAKRSGSISNREVEGIVALLAGSLPGLTDDNVSVLDHNGRTLSEKQRGSTTGLSSEQLNYQRELESYLASKAEDVLRSLVSPGSAIVRVSAEINHENRAVTAEQFGPNEGIVTRENSTASDSSAPATQRSQGGPAGTASNIPTGAAAAGAGTTGAETVTDSTEESEYAVSKTSTQTMIPPGEIKQLNVAVLLLPEVIDPDTNQPQSGDRTIPIDTERKAQILTMQALGITDEARVTVRSAEPKNPPRPQVRDWFDLAREGLPYVGVLRLVLLGMAVFVALILSWRTINRVTGLGRTSVSPELSQLQAQIASQAAARPDAIAAILRQWLTET